MARSTESIGAKEGKEPSSPLISRHRSSRPPGRRATSRSPFITSPAQVVSDLQGPRAPKENETRLRPEENSKRKRSGDPPLEAPCSKRPDCSTSDDRLDIKINNFHRQLTHNVKLTDDALEFFSKIIFAAFEKPDAGAVLLDPLWFNIGETTRQQMPKKWHAANMIVFPIHHKAPKHWALGVVRINASTAKFLHYDSIPSEERYVAARHHFREWLDGCDIDHEVTFHNMDCPRQKDAINCGIYVLACLRNVLQGTECFTTITPSDERNRLVQLIGSDADFGLGEADSKVRWGLKRLLVETQNQLLREVTQATLESLEEDAAKAMVRLRRAEAAVSSAEDSLKTLMTEKNFGLYLRGRVVEAIPDESSPSSSRNNEMTDNSNITQEQHTISIDSCLLLIKKAFRGHSQTQNQKVMDSIDKTMLDAAERIKETEGIITRNEAEVFASKREIQKMEQKLQIKKGIMGYMISD